MGLGRRRLISTQPVSVTEIELKFGDGDYMFRLPLPQLDRLQTKCGAGIGTIYRRVVEGEWHYQDIIETVREGLIGGGGGTVAGLPVTVNPTQATDLINAYVVGRPMSEAWVLAKAILGACIIGYTPPAPRPTQKKRPPQRTKMAGSTTPTR